MAAVLEDSLQSLHTLLNNDNGPATESENIQVKVKDIKQFCTNKISDTNQDNVISLLFDAKHGITSFLRKSANVEELQNGKATALSLLSELVQKFGKKVLPYTLDIKESCMSVYSRQYSRFAKVKSAALPVLIKLLELSVGLPVQKDLKIDEMIEFFLELTKASKLAATVKAGVYHLLGVIAEVYPDLMTPYSEKLLNIYVNELKAKNPKMSVTAGCLDGLTAFMLRFPQSADKEIFKYAIKVVDPSVTYTRYMVPKAGLKLFIRHAGQFRQYLMDDYESIYKKFQSWSHHNNTELLYLGVSAMEAFMKEVSEELVERSRQGKKEGAVFKFFLLEFRSIINNKSSTPKEVSLAIKGYGRLAAPCRSFLSEADTQVMFGEMIQESEHQFFGFSQVEDIDEKLKSISSYLTALSNIIKQIDTVSSPHVLVLERLLVMLIENIPHVNERLHYLCFKSILQLLLTLMGKATVFQQVLLYVVYQGLIRTCSHPVVTETVELEDTVSEIRVKKVSYKDFIPLWSKLLESRQMKDLAAEDFSLADRTQLTEILYNELMAAILKVLNKLDFETVLTDETSEDSNQTLEENEHLSADPVSGITAKKPKDIQVFINIVDFCKELLVGNHWQLFNPWVFTFTHTLIVMSTRHPLVSCFYKLLSVTVTVANKLNYFKKFSLGQSNSVSADESMEFEDASTDCNVKEKNEAYQLIKKFSKEVLVRTKQYRDDLLASCLTLILSLPKEVIVDQMADIIPAIKTTFTIGLSYLPLANIGLNALEYWCRNLPPSVLEPYYAEFLPCLDAYLKTGATEWAAEQMVMVKSKKSSRRGHVPVRLVREKKPVDEKGSHSDLYLVQRRILRYLGSLGGQINHNLLAHTDEEISQEAIAWDTQKHLKFDIPFFDMKPAIYFDPFLPQVVKLAQQSSDRQTKVAACELLHSLVLYALGRGAQNPGETQKKYPMEQLYRKLFPPLLSLSCDVEQVCRDLFEPLVMQSIHWFTNNKMAESPETMALLDCIFDGLTQASDTALRDFSAKCLREFLQWSLKQISKKMAEKNPINAKSVLKRIFSYALHPSAFKRLGAALAFNNIYMVFREEDALVDRFTFDIVVHFVESLALAHNDDKSLGTQEQCVKVLEHLERIMIKKADMLKKDPGPKLRPEPSFWNSRKLEFAVRWLTRKCGSLQTECRHACMRMVFKLCTLLPGVKSPDHFFAIIHKDEGAAYFLQRFEGGGSISGESHGLRAYPTMKKLKKPFSVGLAQQWFDMLLAALDCYCWIFGEKLIAPMDMFPGKGSEVQSHIFKSVKYFLNKLAFSDVNDAARLMAPTEAGMFTPMETDDYNRMKCTVIIRVWNFLTVLLQNYSSDVSKVVPSGVWCEKLWKLLCDCVMRPNNVGFNMADTEIMAQLPKEMLNVLVLTKFLPTPQMNKLKSCLTQYLSKDCNLTSLLPVKLASPAIDYTHLTQLVEGYRQLHRVKLLIEHLPSGDKANLALELFNNVFQGIVRKEGTELTSVRLSPPALNSAKSLLMLALELGLNTEVLIKKLLDKTTVQGLCRGTKIGHSSLFFTMFSSTLATYFSQAGRDILGNIMSKAKVEQLSAEQLSVGAVLIAVLDHVANDRTLRKKEGVSLSCEVLSHWDKLRSWWDGEATSENQSLALLVLTKLMLIDSKCVSDPNSKTFVPVFKMYQSMLKDQRTTMTFKNQVLDLLPFFATLRNGHQEQLKDSLNSLIADNFPPKCSEFAEGTREYKDYITAINKLLAAMKTTGSLMLLEIVISVLCRERKHLHKDAIQAGIASFIMRLPTDQQKPALDVPFAIFLKEGFSLEIRRTAIERVCLPFLQLSSNGAVVEFFMEHAHKLMNYLDVKLKLVTDSILENQLTIKICCFQLLELMYARLDKDDVNSVSESYVRQSAINQRFHNGNPDSGEEMTQKITKAAQDATSEVVCGETMPALLRRQYHCYAYNLMISIISCVQTNNKFYQEFIFQDNIAKGQFLLDNIIDKDQVYEFQVDLEAPLERCKKFVSIRNEAREKSRSEGLLDTSATSSLHLVSQYLADSSLCDDLNQFDFNLSTTSQQMTEATVTDNYIELEMDTLNQHECMAPLIALIRHMTTTNICPEVPKGTVPEEMPAWMQYLHDKMTSPQSHINVKLFIAKLVMNCSQTFQPYAKFWLRPLCQLFVSQEVSGKGITYFAVDLIVTMVTWHTVAIPEDSAEERALASGVLKIVMTNISHPVCQVFRKNLELLKTLLECWRERVQIPYDVVYNLLNPADPKPDKYATGVQVLGVVVAGRFQPYGPSAPVSYERYMSFLVGTMNHHHKTVYEAAAEVVGLIFSHRDDTQKETNDYLENTVVAQLTGFSNAKAGNFITCVHSINKSYPPITERFLSKLLFMLPSLPDVFMAQCLEVVLGHVDKMENPFLELYSKELPRFLKHRDEETKVVSLKIVKSMMSKLKGSELLSLLPSVAGCSSDQSTPACRMIMLDILKWTYNNFIEAEDEDSKQIIRLTKETLLKGLCDEDLVCRCVCQNFWSSNTRLPEGTLDRTVSMLEAMYSPTTEPHFLVYATNLLLAATSKSPDYQREIFEHPLSECKFNDYLVQSSWRQRHAAMTPLFSTLVTQAMDTSEGDDSLQEGVRATQDAAQFTATIDMAGNGKAFNWLTQSSLDTFAASSTIGGDSKLLFNRDHCSVRLNSRGQTKGGAIPVPLTRKTLVLKPGGAGEGKASTSNEGTEGMPESLTDVWRLKRTFIKDKQSQAIFFMKRNTRLSKMREEALKEQKARRENQVTIYRKYRIGDLPDIQIKYQDIIAPLQALAQCDSTIARLLFSSLFQAIFSEMDKVKTEREVEELVQDINKSLESILSQSTIYSPPFMGSILNILYELRAKLKVPANKLSIAAMNSNQQTLGIVVLEEQLIQSDTGQASTAGKRARQNTVESPADDSQWIELSRLYKSVHEFDVLQGIFCDKIGTKDITREAVEAEVRGDYNGAFEKYREALCKTDWPDGDPFKAEINFWKDNQMQCLNNLCRWDDLEKIAVEGVDRSNVVNLDHVWEDEFYQERFLPYVIRSKMKLMLSGSDIQQSLLTFIPMVDEHSRQHLLGHYSTELALMYLWQQDYNKSRHYTCLAFDSLLQVWSNTATLLELCRRDNLHKVQALVELQEFLHYVDPARHVEAPGESNLMNLWDGRLPHQLLDPVTVWDDVVTNRIVYLKHFKQKLLELEVGDNESSQSENIYTGEDLDEMTTQFYLEMANSCQKQNNSTLALKLLENTEACQKSRNKQISVEWTHLTARIHRSKAESSDIPWENSTFCNVISTLDQLNKLSDNPVLAEVPDLGLRHHVLKGQALNALVKGLLDIKHFLDIDNETKSKLASQAGLDIEHFPDIDNETKSKLASQAGPGEDERDQLIGRLLSKSFDSLKAAVGQDFDGRTAHRNVVMTTGEANLELAKFCDKYLHMREDDSENLPKTCVVAEFPQTVVVCLLKAMQEGLSEARERFPRLLQIVEHHPDVIAVFNKKAAEIPSWMFILWVSQMTALLDKKEVVVVGPLLIRIADEYPQALVYAFRMSSEGFKFEAMQESQKSKDTVDILNQKMNNMLVNKFISALEQFGQPDMIFKDWCSDMRKVISSQARSKDERMRMFREIYSALFDVKTSDAASSGTQTSISSTSAVVEMGEYRKNFAMAFKEEFDRTFGADGKKLLGMGQREFREGEVKLLKLLTQQSVRSKLNAPVKLKDYCAWLAEFNPNRNGRDLEIPGQYDGLKKPLPEYHVKIGGFDERVLVMSSLRKPKCITIRGNDQKDYPYLVKSGEDLRLDQRIETLFFIMNKVMASDPACRCRKLHLKTYKVISMTPRVGMIEWMGNTQTLKDFLRDALTDKERKYIDSEHGPKRQHENWVHEIVPNQNDRQNNQLVFDEVFKKYSLTETVKEFRQIEGKIPWDLSRRAIKRMSSSPEAFHVLRAAMITSHAVICICQYLLGIGDRHLSNFMVNLKTGHMVGIDFGHAFGSATQFIPVPELVPFRLTRQLVNLNMTLQVKGQMESTMTHVLRALREDSDLLLSTMDVFIKEPSLDWLKNAEKQIEAGNMATDADKSDQFYPKEKIQFARRKLRGDHPIKIMREELNLGHKKRDSYEDRVRVLNGDKKDNERARLAALHLTTDHLTAEQQVAALIDHATDPNILGRMYTGWEPWM